jgi:hypothetical protein
VGPIEDCRIAPGVAWGGPGSEFGMNGTLTAGAGVADSECGAPGSDIMFRLSVSEMTLVTGRATVDGRPAVLSIREGCEADVELAVDCEGELETSLEPGEYIVIVDQTSQGAQPYQLELVFD